MRNDDFEACFCSLSFISLGKEQAKSSKKELEALRAELKALKVAFFMLGVGVHAQAQHVQDRMESILGRIAVRSLRKGFVLAMRRLERSCFRLSAASRGLTEHA